MPNLQNLLKRRRVVVELDPEVHARLRARLASLRDPEGADAEHELATQPDPAGLADGPVAAGSDPSRAEVDAPILPARAIGRSRYLQPPSDQPIRLPSARRRRDAAERTEHTDGDGWDRDDWFAAPAPVPLWVTPDEPTPPPFEEAPPTDLTVMVPTVNAFDAGVETPLETPLEVPVEVPAAPEPQIAAPEPQIAAQPAQPAQPARPTAAKPPAGRSRAARAIVSCPYCAEPLQLPPVASGRCPRCRQQIVVRRVGDRAIYLTEAALPVFLAERRRAVHAGRWTRERDRWLELAMAGGVEPANVTRLARQLVSEDVIAAARSLYMSTVERAARTARRERRWEDAGRLRSDQALALYRIARFVRPVPAEVLAVHRDGLASSLRGVAEIAKWAELRAAACCEACRADDGRTIRIADELRRPSLPHEACQKGLCRCRWYLADRDRAIVSDLLRRQTRPHRQPRSAPDS